MKDTFYLIDGHAQIFRAYYAPFQQLNAPSGEPVKATYTFTQMLLSILRDHQPAYLAMTMDVEDAARYRRELDSKYKANREESPEDLEPQVDRIMQIVRLLGIPIYGLAGYEADDVIATIARGLMLDPETLELVIVSRDKDLYQLLGPGVKMWDPGKDEIIDPESLEAKLGFTPEQAVDIQTLMGDNVDNVPGIHGVGIKKATALIQKYGSAEAVAEHADELTPKLRERVLEFKDQLPVTRELVTLRADAPVEFDLEACRVHPPDFGALRALFKKLGFRRLLSQLEAFETLAPGESSPGEATSDTPADSPHKKALESTHEPARAQRGSYTLVDTEEAFADFLDQLQSQVAFAIDTETTSLTPVDSDLVGLSFSWEPGVGFYLPLRCDLVARTLDFETTLKALRPILEDPAVRKCGQNIKYDIQVLRQCGIELRGVDFDSMIASYLLFPDRRSHGMDALARELLGHETISITELIGKGKNQKSMLQVEPSALADYAGEDADITWRLQAALHPQIDSSPMRKLFRDVEMPLVQVLAGMEYEGVRLDVGLLRSISKAMSERIDHLREEIHRAAGHEFLIDSPKQLGVVLFDEIGLRTVKKTKTSRSTDANVLRTLVAETAHELPRLVLEYRELAKLRGTYVDPLPEMISPRTGRLHASFHQTVTATGRLSSSDPNIQNIPIRTDQGREIRKAFVARDEDHALITADYSQIELRILAHLCGDEALVQAFQEDQDIHTFVAAQIAGVSLDKVTREQRTQAKAVNFGIIYGQGPFGLSRNLGIPQKVARAFIAAYKDRYPGIVNFMAQCVAEAETTDRVTTILGRQRLIPEIHSRNRVRRAQGERLAINTVVQGSAADMIKVAMVRIHQRMTRESLPLTLVIQVHDELVAEVPKSRVEELSAVMKEEMVAAIPLRVPVRVDVAWGRNWLEAK